MRLGANFTMREVASSANSYADCHYDILYLSRHIQYLRQTVSICNRFPWFYLNCFQFPWFCCIIIVSGILIAMGVKRRERGGGRCMFLKKGRIKKERLGADTDTHFHTMFTQVYHKWQWYHVWFLRYGAQQTGFFVILDLFTLLPHNLKNQNFKQMKKHLEILSFYTVNHKGQSYDVWFLRYGAWQTEFFVILDHVLSFYCPYLTNQKK